MELHKLNHRIENAKPLDFGYILNNSIDLFKKTWVQGLVTILLTMVMAIPVLMIVYVPLIAMGAFGAYSAEYDPYGYDNNTMEAFSPILLLLFFVLYIFAIVAMSAISFGLRAGFYRICKIKDFNKVAREDYFYFFKKPYFYKTVKLSLALVGIAVIASSLCFIPLLYAIVPLTYITVIYAFNPDKSVSEIINLSFKLGNAKWFITFGLLVVCGFLATVVGFLMCFVGVYVTQSFTWLPTYIIYKEVVSFDDNSLALNADASQDPDDISQIDDVSF